LGDTKTIRPFTLKGHRTIAHSASPHGLLLNVPERKQLKMTERQNPREIVLSLK